MFCSKCGASLPDGSAFCSACGTNLAAVAAPVQVQVMPDYQSQKNAVRQSEINELARTIEYFSHKSDEFEYYDACCTLVNYYAGGAKSSLLVWGCINFTLGLFMLLASAGAASLVFLLPGAAMIVGGILMKVNNRKQYNYYQQEYAQISQELYDYYVAFPNCPVGPEYVNPDILELIMGVLQSGRADTIKESINLLIAEANQSEINEYLAEIEQNTAAINAQTRVAAIFAAASFFDD